MKRWNETQDNFIIKNYGWMRTREVADLLGRSYAAVKERAIKLGVRKEAAAENLWRVGQGNKSKRDFSVLAWSIGTKCDSRVFSNPTPIPMNVGVLNYETDEVWS